MYLFIYFFVIAQDYLLKSIFTNRHLGYEKQNEKRTKTQSNIMQFGKEFINALNDGQQMN
jgi:hypothetical protein